MESNAENGMVVGFGAAAGEDDFLGAGVEERRDLFARCFNSGAGPLAECVDGRGVAEVGGKIGKHGVEDGGVDGGGGVVIEVDAGHTTINRILLAGNHEEWLHPGAGCFCKCRCKWGQKD